MELIVRPWHGTRYFPLPVIFFHAHDALMPLFSAVTHGRFSWCRFMTSPPPWGSSASAPLKALFPAFAIHGVRLYRRMLNMELRKSQQIRGPCPALLLRSAQKETPSGSTRIVLEPAFVFIAAKVLESIFIFQSGLTTYCEFTACASHEELYRLVPRLAIHPKAHGHEVCRTHHREARGEQRQ